MEHFIVIAMSMIILLAEYFYSPKPVVNKGITATEEGTAQVQQNAPEEGAKEALQKQQDAAEAMKESLTQGVSSDVVDKKLITDTFGSPYAKYRLDTADMEMWFYEDFYLVFDKDLVSLKDYEVTISKVN